MVTWLGIMRTYLHPFGSVLYRTATCRCPAEVKHPGPIGYRMIIMQTSHCVREFVHSKCKQTTVDSSSIRIYRNEMSEINPEAGSKKELEGIDFLIKPSLSPGKIKWFLVSFGKWQFNLHHNDNRNPLCC